MVNKATLLLLLTYVVAPRLLIAATTGSWSSVNSTAGFTGTAGIVNTIIGYVTINSNVSFAASTASINYNGVFPLNGPLIMNNGTLVLYRPLALNPGVTITSGGKVVGQGYSLDLPDNIGSLTLPAMTYGNITLVLHSNVVLSGVQTFTVASVIDGNGFSIDCTSGGFTVGSNASLSFNNVTLLNINGTDIQCSDNTGTYTINDSTWVMSGNYDFSLGKFIVAGPWDITGKYIFSYKSSQTTVVQSGGSILFDSGVTFSYVPPSSSKSLISLTDVSSVLHFYETNLAVTSTGLQFTNGTVIVDGLCPVYSGAQNIYQAVSLGDGVSAGNNINLTIFPGSGFKVMTGFLVNNNV